MRALSRRLRSARRATAAVEFAIVAPVLLALATGSVGLCRAVRARMDLSLSAQTMAQLIAAQGSVSPALIEDFCRGAQDEMSPYPTTGLTISIASVTRNASSGTAGVDWTDVSCGEGTAIANAATLAASVIPNNGDSTIVAQANYSLANPLSIVLPSSFALEVTAMARPRANATVTYN